MPLKQQFETTAAEELLRLSLDAAPCGIAMFDNDMRYIASSRVYRDSLGLGGETLEGRGHYDIFPDLPEGWKAVHRRVLAGETIREDSDPFPRADGSVSYWQWEMRPWHRADGEVGGAVLFNQDITAKIRREIDMRRLSNGLSRAGFGIVMVDAKTNQIDYANPAYASVLGYAPDELTGVSILDTYPPAARAPLAAAIAAGQASGNSQFEAERQRRDGSTIQTLVARTLIDDPVDGGQYWVGTLLDITEVKRLAAELRAKDALLSSYIENAPVCIALVNAQGKIVTTNSAAAALFRCDKSQLLGRDALELHRLEDRSTVLEHADILLRDGHLRREYRLRRFDGSEFWAILTLVRLADGVRLGFVQSIDDLKQSELARRAAEDDLYAMVELGPAVVLYRARLTASGVQVSGWHGDALRLTGDAGVSIQTILEQPDSRAVLLEIVSDPSRSEGVSDQPLTAADGTVRIFRNRIRVAHRDATGAEIVGYLSDVTRDKQEQQKLQRVATLVTLGEMATGMAHELNQPLASISFAAQNASFQLKRATPDLQAVGAKVEKVVAEAQRAASLLEHMKIFARNEPRPVEAVSWRTALDGALKILASRLRYFTIRDEVPAALPAVTGTPVLMEQVLINLIGNAMDAYEAMAAVIPAEARIVVVSAEAAAGAITLRVSDQAGGIPPGMLARVFEPFFTTKPNGKGTGLGLALCFGTVTEMGGTLNARNENGGAVLEIRLPAADAG